MDGCHVRWVIGVVVVVGMVACAQPSPQLVEPGDEVVLPMVITRHVLTAEAAAEAASHGWADRSLRVAFPPDLEIEAGDLVAEYMTQANDLHAHVTADLAITVVRQSDGDGAWIACRTALEPETVTRTEHVPATTREVPVEQAVSTLGVRCHPTSQTASEPYSTYETRCQTRMRPGPRGQPTSSYECSAVLVHKTRSRTVAGESCSLGIVTGIQKRLVTEEVPAHDVTTSHRGFRALEPRCGPLAAGDAAEAAAWITGVIYVVP